jgi:hypothetical protein
MVGTQHQRGEHLALALDGAVPNPTAQKVCGLGSAHNKPTYSF